jgi:stearoyl-CoA desaturase (Delta-9 desaturase)
MFMGDVVPGEKGSFLNAAKGYVFWLVHAACFLALYTGVSWVAAAVCAGLYVLRMWGITAGFHRYFSHRSYKVGRVTQFVIGWIGTMAAQKGPIWWASHHRHHHQHSDTEEDIHSPIMSGIWFAHVGWVLSSEFVETRNELVKDLLKFPEIRFLDRFNLLPPTLLAIATYYFGELLAAFAPGMGTNGFQMLVWGFFISTVLVYHGTFCINSFTHLIGRRRFKTTDDSRNSLFFALVTLGEGWHNNHHRYPGSESQGMYWWEIDIAHYVVRFLEKLGLVWDIREYPKRIFAEAEANGTDNYVSSITGRSELPSAKRTETKPTLESQVTVEAVDGDETVGSDKRQAVSSRQEEVDLTIND